MTWKPVYENVYDVFMNTWLQLWDYDYDAALLLKKEASKKE